MTTKQLGLLLLAIWGTHSACELGNIRLTSQHNATESHRHGQNCMQCHVSGEEGRGWFEVAGSVYNKSLNSPYVNATIVLTTLPNGGGRELLRIEGDAFGNFYTTQGVPMRQGVYAYVVGNQGNVRYMNEVVRDGQCNSCHGNTTQPIWIE